MILYYEGIDVMCVVWDNVCFWCVILCLYYMFDVIMFGMIVGICNDWFYK